MKRLLEPAFQPIVDLKTGEVAHYEALARIRRDPTDTGHAKLIQLAERHHFIHLVDLAILEMAAEEAVREGQRIASNFSALTIEVHLHDVVTKLAELDQVRKKGLVVEITETVPVRDRRKVAYFIDAVREMGCLVALDDFGNGFGHFTEDLVCYLEPDFLKLDGTILARAERSGDHRGLKHATALAQSLGAQVIAEFVDTEKKIELLRQFGVRYGQGWAFGKPMRGAFSAESFPRRFAHERQERRDAAQERNRHACRAHS